MPGKTAEAVDFPKLARELGLTERQRADLIRQRLVTPVGGESRQGAPTWITPESADLLREARRVLEWIKRNPSLAVGVTLVVVMRLLTSGAVRPVT
jgi:hypothetical protein